MKSKNGIAYTLTLEHNSPRRHKSKRSRKRELEEIKVKIPGPYSRKKNKDKENLNRKEKLRPEVSVSTNQMDDSNDSTKVDNKTVDSTNDDVRQSESLTNDEDKKLKIRRILTLQVRSILISL